MVSLDPLSQRDLVCSTCGEKINLIRDETQSYKPESGRLIGHFRLIEVVGQGAFGVVWRALDTELDRVVAVKTPRTSVIGAEDTNQFIREARAAAQLKHPNIVTVHEVGRVDDFLYIISDFIDGMTLSAWLRSNRPSSREASTMCMTIANALEHAHQAGVIHRDMKPGNILLDADGSPNIADFGLAKREVGDLTMSFDGQIAGTPAYMSPEQATGTGFDRRSDIYSLGVILFELLTGEKPFRGNHRMLLHQVVNDEPPGPRKLNATIPRDVETICLKCLEKNPTRRYQTAAELADDLQRFLVGEPILARPINAIERVWKWAVRRPLVASILTALFLTISLGLAGVTWQWRRVLASQQRHAMTQLDLIRHAEPRAVESAIEGLQEFRRWTSPALQTMSVDPELPASERFRCLLAVMNEDPEHIESVVEQLIRMQPPDVLGLDELTLGADMLAKVDAFPMTRLMNLAKDTKQPDDLRFRLLFMLARTTDSSTNSDTLAWGELTPFVIRHLVAAAANSPGDYRKLVEAFQPVHKILLPAFDDLLASDIPNSSERFTAASIIGEYAAEDPDYLCNILLTLRPDQYRVILPRLLRFRDVVTLRFEKLLAEQSGATATSDFKEELLMRKATAAVTLLHLNEVPTGVWPLFREQPDASLRTLLIHRCAELGLPPEKLISQLKSESDVSVRRAILLTLGQYDQLADGIRNELHPLLEDLYRKDPDAGIHSAVAWLLRSWNESDLLTAMDGEPTSTGPMDGRQWYVNSQGTTMTVIDHPPAFTMGPADDEPLQTPFDRRHLRKVNRRFAMGSTEVTWRQFQKYALDYGATNHKHPENYGPDPDGPVLTVSWIHAVKYCRWLSEQEEIPADQMCFPPLNEITEDMTLPDDITSRTGYRLPTEGEWECACRAGTITRRFFGDSDVYLNSYGWHIGNSMDYARRVGLLKPNDHGLFDVYGNAWEWCLDRHGTLPKTAAGIPFVDVPKLVGTKPRILRGGSMNSRKDALRSAQRDFLEALHDRNHNVGMRIVRTLPVSASTGSIQLQRQE
jgi:formylglycine-generating enzyme required for sulfatase activity